MDYEIQSLMPIVADKTDIGTIHRRHCRCLYHHQRLEISYCLEVRHAIWDLVL